MISVTNVSFNKDYKLVEKASTIKSQTSFFCNESLIFNNHNKFYLINFFLNVSAFERTLTLLSGLVLN